MEGELSPLLHRSYRMDCQRRLKTYLVLILLKKNLRHFYVDVRIVSFYGIL